MAAFFLISSLPPKGWIRLNMLNPPGEKRQLEITPIAINILIDAAAKSPSPDLLDMVRESGPGDARRPPFHMSMASFKAFYGQWPL